MDSFCMSGEVAQCTGTTRDRDRLHVKSGKTCGMRKKADEQSQVSGEREGEGGLQPAHKERQAMPGGWRASTRRHTPRRNMMDLMDLGTTGGQVEPPNPLDAVPRTRRTRM